MGEWQLLPRLAEDDVLLVFGHGLDDIFLRLGDGAAADFVELLWVGAVLAAVR